MINAIAELGRFEKSKNPDITNFDVWLEDSYDNGKNPHLLLIEIEKNVSESGEIVWNYKRVDVMENGKVLKSKLLYKKGSSRGTNKTPTSKIAESLSGTFCQKIKKWFLVNQTNSSLNNEQKIFLSDIANILSDNSKKIISDLYEKVSGFDKGGIVLSVAFIENEKSKFIGEYDFFKNFITEEPLKDYKYSSTFKKHSFAQNSICSICNESKPEVYGFFTSLSFYTIDKPGMVTGGFNQADTWKNYPICLDCALDVEMGKKLIEQKLSFSFYGLRYYFIPKKTLNHANGDVFEKIFEYKNSTRIKESDRNRFTNDEDELFDILSDQKNSISFNMLFYEKQNAALRIKASIEDVLPSRIRQLFKAKDFVDNMVFFEEKNKDGKRKFSFTFKMLRDFFPNSRIEGNHDKSFLELVQKIFNNSQIDYDYIIKNIAFHLKKTFVNKDKQNEWKFSYFTTQSFMLLNFFNKLNLLNNTLEVKEMNKQFLTDFKINSVEKFEEKANLFFEKFSTFFGDDAKKSIFLLGVLTQFLLNIQKNQRNSSPFRSRLKGLKMDARDIVTLFPEIIEKLEQYDSNFYKKLEDYLSEYLLSAGDYKNWNIPVDEMNYIFVIGMNLSKYFKIINEKIGENND